MALLCERRLDLKHPPTSVGGIRKIPQARPCRLDLNNPPTSVGGIPTFSKSKGMNELLVGLGSDLAGVETIKLVLNNPVTLACGSFQPFTIQDCDLAA